MGNANRTCSVPECNRKHDSFGFCAAHATRYRRYGDPLAGKPIRNPLPSTCSVDGCDRKTDSIGMCTMHATRFRRHGDPMGDVPSAKDAIKRTECVIYGCQRADVKALGMCGMHYARFVRTGTTDAKTPKPKTTIPCAVAGCQRKKKAYGYCMFHLRRLRKYGNPEVAIAERGDAMKFIQSLPDTTECIPWPFGKRGRASQPYGTIYDGTKVIGAHRFSLTQVCSPIDDTLHALHTCDNSLCVNPQHLYWGTNADNVADRVKRGRSRSKLKLSDDDAREVFRIRSEVNETNHEIASRFSVSHETVRRVLRGLTHKNVFEEFRSAIQEI